MTIVYSVIGPDPGCSEAMCTHFLNPSMIEGVDALLGIGKGKCEDQLLLLQFFLPQPIFPDGDLINEDFMARRKGWVVRRTGGSAGPTSTNQDTSASV
jgi:hypothetical protein